MSLRHQFRRLGNSFLGLMPPALRRMLLKGFSDRPDLAEACGYQVHPRVFWSAMPVLEEISRARLAERRALPGIDLRLESAVELTAGLVRDFAGELAEIPRQRTPGCQVWFDNGTYADFDAATLYAMLRRLKPKRYIEVGCGFSTRASTHALARNAREGHAAEAHFIEPYPSANLLEQTLPGPLLRQKVETVAPELFASLQAGDVLFIDTSHVLRTQNDVEHEFLRILPALASGVWVHVHDIFTPYDYPEEWIFGVPRGGNNEQYALECLLSGGDRFQVDLPVYCLWREHRAALDPLCAGAMERPAAFWIQRR